MPTPPTPPGHPVATACCGGCVEELLTRLLARLKSVGRTIPGDGPYRDAVEDARAETAVLLTVAQLRREDAVLCASLPRPRAVGGERRG